MLTRYRQRYPQVVVDVSFEDRIMDLVDERYDLACASWRARFRWDLRASLAAPAAPDRLLSNNCGHFCAASTPAGPAPITAMSN